MFARSDRSRRLKAIGSDERRDVGRGQLRPLPRRLGAVRTDKHQPRRIGGAVAGHEQLRSELANITNASLAHDQDPAGPRQGRTAEPQADLEAGQ